MKNSLPLAVLLFLLPSARAAPPPTQSEQAWLKSALESVAAKKYSQGIKVLHYLTRVQPEKGLYWFNLGNAQTLAGERKAGASYLLTLELNPANTVIYHQDGSCLIHSNYVIH